MTEIVLPPDVNEPYPQPPISIAEYARRLSLAISRASSMAEREGLKVHRECLELVTEDDWPRWYAWNDKFDEHGLPPRPPEPEYYRTCECISTASLAAKIGWDVDILEDQVGVRTEDGKYLREGDGWRFFIRNDGEDQIMIAAE